MTVEIKAASAWSDPVFVDTMQETAADQHAWKTYLGLSPGDKALFKEALEWDFVVPLDRLLGLDKPTQIKVALTSQPKQQGMASQTPPKSRVLTDRNAIDDYNLIMSDLHRLNYQGNYGPTTIVTTKLKWDNKHCRDLYLKLKEDLHDKGAPKGGFYYLTSVNPKGKSGFRITVHSKQVAKLNNSKTLAILHIDNS